MLAELGVFLHGREEMCAALAHGATQRDSPTTTSHMTAAKPTVSAKPHSCRKPSHAARMKVRLAIEPNTTGRLAIKFVQRILNGPSAKDLPGELQQGPSRAQPASARPLGVRSRRRCSAG